MTQLDECYVEHIPWKENTKVDALSNFSPSEVKNSSESV